MLTYMSTFTNGFLTSRSSEINSEEVSEELSHRPTSTDPHSEPASLSILLSHRPFLRLHLLGAHLEVDPKVILES